MVQREILSDTSSFPRRIVIFEFWYWYNFPRSSIKWTTGPKTRRPSGACRYFPAHFPIIPPSRESVASTLPRAAFFLLQIQSGDVSYFAAVRSQAAITRRTSPQFPFRIVAIIHIFPSRFFPLRKNPFPRRTNAQFPFRLLLLEYAVIFSQMTLVPTFPLIIFSESKNVCWLYVVHGQIREQGTSI